MTSTRHTLEGTWILDKTRPDWSMTPYLQTMQVDPLAIEAHEKGDLEADTFHTIQFLPGNRVQLIKRSRVNNDLVVDLELGMEQVEHLSPGQRPKTMIATADRARTFLEIQSTLQTMGNGTASVRDIKRLHHENEAVVLIQELTITNERTGASHSLQRTFLPYYDTPPHLVVEETEEVNT
ncbi:hypothetical protein FisN_10Hh304 [Fistulifera solaris]|jgi:hypothetical protein|uniref:THAP4-like heme-binding beta-barrel domain-containing protein n=1 Tax=Fistulifera solaris TaxID=1519565 RepID=A0A1Z5JXE8_FISSO|nr:hypothetical protein FisN_10Hh304 [Fistulifera solaris]|eukprot:GAX18498.1 hypothetical protein FisN_10Hh304 [Fistulifera solaris]